MRRLAAVLIGSAVAVVAGSAEAADGGASEAELGYAAPTECPDDAAFRVDVARHVHDSSHAAGARLELRIEARDSRYDGELVAFDGEGHRGSRHISGKTCAEVAHALAFLAGLVIELGGQIDPAASADSKLPSKPARMQTTVRAGPPVTAQPVSAGPRGPRLSAVLLAGVRGAFGPSVRPTGELVLELSSPSARLWSPAARLVAWIGNSELESSDGSAALRFVGGRFELCPLRFGNSSFVVRPCAGGELGAVEARGYIADNPKTVTKPWVSAEVTLRAQWFASRSLFAELGLGPVFPLVRTHYFFTPDRPLYSVPDVSARAALGLGLLF